MNRYAKLIVTACLIIFVTTAGLHAGQIHDAVNNGDLEKVRALIEADPALLESRYGRGNTPLHSACFAGQVAVAKFLIEKDADITARNNYGFTPLHAISGRRDPDCDFIQYLIARGADVNARLNRGITALHFASMSGNLEVAGLLINHGADLNAFDRLLYGTILQTAINWGRNENMAKLLVESGAKLNRKFGYGNTELHMAALKGYTELVQLLIEHGADINAVNDYDHTALYYAAKHGYRSMADKLVVAGSNQSDITETNYGNAPQLTAELKEGESWVWYLGGPGNAGYAVKTKNHLLIFDNTGIDESAESGLANGHLNPNELAGQKITILVTKVNWLQNPQFFEIAKRMLDINWVLDAKPTISDTNNMDIPPYHLATPHESFSMDGIKVHTIPASGRGNGGAIGLGYLVETDGVKVFDAGFHASVNKAPQIEQYRKEIDFLKDFGPIDIAILSIRGHLPLDYEPYLYLLEKLEPKVVYLIGGDGIYEESKKCIEVLRARSVPVFYPEGGIALGQRFHYQSPDTYDFTDLKGDYLGQTPPGDTPVVFAPEVVSTIYMEHSAPTFSPDGNEVFWRVAKGFISDPDLLIVPKTMKRIGDRWTVPMDSPYGGSPFFSPDGKRLYFSNLPPDGKAEGPYFVEKQGNNWSEPNNLGFVGRFPELKAVGTPSITSDGTLYFGGDIVGSKEGFIKDIRICRAKLINGEYSKFEFLPPCINLPDSWNYSPFIAPDESYLIFSSNRPGSLDKYGDLYISFHDINKDTWSEPVNLGEPINTRGQDSSPGVSPDGKYLFFTGPASGHQADIFWVSAGIIDKLKAKVVQEQNLETTTPQEGPK